MGQQNRVVLWEAPGDRNLNSMVYKELLIQCVYGSASQYMELPGRPWADSSTSNALWSFCDYGRNTGFAGEEVEKQELLSTAGEL